jgi:hypothetical protein
MLQEWISSGAQRDRRQLWRVDVSLQGGEG